MVTSDRRKDAKPLFGEISPSTGAKDITRGFLDMELRQPIDTVLQARGAGNFQLYEEVLRDDQVKSTLQQRILAVVSREWVVEAGGDSAADKAAAEALEENLKALLWDQITGKMLFGVFYGYAVSECLWARDGGRIVLDGIKVRRRQRFRWDRDFRLRLLTLALPQGEIMPERKFWTFATGADHDDDPYGLGLAHWLYWPVWFKRNGLKFWLIFLEKFGTPTGIGKFPPNALDEDKEKLLAAVQAIQTDAGIIIPDGMLVELLEAKRSGSADQAKFYDKMDAAIAKVVLSQTMTTDDGSSRAQADVHFDVRQEVVKADSDLICNSFNCGPAVWLTEWNFPGAKPPKVWRRVEDDPDLKPQAERDKLLHEIGFEPTDQYVHETYGDGFVRRQEPDPPPAFAGAGAEVPPAEPDPAFAEGDLDALEALARDAGRDWRPLVGPVADAITAAAEESADFDEFRDRLSAIAQSADAGAAREMVARGDFAAALAGRLGVDVER